MKESAEFFLTPDCSGIENMIFTTDQFFKAHGITNSTAHEQMIILDELVKFGSTFGNSGFSKEQIKISINIAEESIVIEVSKPIDGIESECLDKLDETIQFIRGFQDPFEAFMKMKSKPHIHHGNGENGLRLARIAYLGKAIVDFFINEENILNLSVFRNFKKEN